MNIHTAPKLTYEGAFAMLPAAAAKAKPMKLPICIAVVDESGPLPNEENVHVLLSLGMPRASDGKLTCVRGGLPVMWDGTVVGGIGISAGTQEQDEEVARASLAALR